VAGHSFHIRVGERTHQVSVVRGEAPGEPAHVTVDGEAYEVVRGPGGAVIVRPWDEVAHRCVTLDGQAWPGAAHVPGHAVSIAVETAQAAALREALASGGAGAAGGERIKAPMPGRIVRVMVAVGDVVERGTPVIIVEAMKMENEMYASGPGKVASILVAQGATVEAGQLLCEIEALPADA